MKPRFVIRCWGIVLNGLMLRTWFVWKSRFLNDFSSNLSMHELITKTLACSSLKKMAKKWLQQKKVFTTKKTSKKKKKKLSRGKCLKNQTLSSQPSLQSNLIRDLQERKKSNFFFFQICISFKFSLRYYFSFGSFQDHSNRCWIILIWFLKTFLLN